MDNYLKKIVDLASNYMNEEPSALLKKQMQELLNDPSKNLKELQDRLEKDLEFGTAGLRAHMEAGYNRMNQLSCFRVGLAISTYFAKRSLTPTIVIGFDGRLNSQLFAKEISDVFACFGFNIKIFNEPVPTPLCAFATKYYQAHLGLMVTASHNPKEYNGVKIFDENAMQLDRAILIKLQDLMKESTSRNEFYAQHTKQSTAILIGQELFEAYFSELKKTKFFAENEKSYDKSIVYTPLHGVGEKFFLRALKEEGFDKVFCVKNQSEPNGNFPSVAFPNPEEHATLDLAYELAYEKNVSYVFANDPDADRLQVSVLNSLGKFEKLTGNQMGILLSYFAIKKAQSQGIKPLVATSIVSSRMLKHMAKKMGACYVEALTGFGNIAQMAIKAQEKNDATFVFAYEEAIGFLVGQTVLDKDGISVSARFMEILAFLSKNNKSIQEFLLKLSQEFGLFLTKQWSIMFEGIDAKAKIDSIMLTARNFNEETLETILNLKNLKKFDLTKNNFNSEYEGMYSDIIIFENDTLRLIIRPSGTEPKIKFYLEIISQEQNESILQLQKNLLKDIEQIKLLIQKAIC